MSNSLDFEYKKLLEKYITDHKDFIEDNYRLKKQYYITCDKYNGVIAHFDERTKFINLIHELYCNLESSGFEIPWNIIFSKFNYNDVILEYTEVLQNEYINESGFELNNKFLFYYPKECFSGENGKVLYHIDELYMEIGAKGLKYKKHLSKLEDEIEHLRKATETIRKYRRLVVVSSDAIEKLINPILRNKEDSKIPRDFLRRLVGKAFEFYEVCTNVFWNMTLSNILDEEFEFDKIEKACDEGLDKITEVISNLKELYIKDNQLWEGVTMCGP